MGDPYKYLYIWFIDDRLVLRRVAGEVRWYDAFGLHVACIDGETEDQFVERWYNG